MSLHNDARSALAHLRCDAVGSFHPRQRPQRRHAHGRRASLKATPTTLCVNARIICPRAEIFADVHVKHAVPLGDWTLEDAAHDTVDRGLADALIVSGVGTGKAADIADVGTVRHACPDAKILLGSGVNLANVKDFMQIADGVIVGSSLKRDGKLANPVDPKRVAALVKAIR